MGSDCKDLVRRRMKSQRNLSAIMSDNDKNVSVSSKANFLAPYLWRRGGARLIATSAKRLLVHIVGEQGRYPRSAKLPLQRQAKINFANCLSTTHMDQSK